MKKMRRRTLEFILMLMCVVMVWVALSDFEGAKPGFVGYVLV